MNFIGAGRLMKADQQLSNYEAIRTDVPAADAAYA